jgi:integrase
MPPLPTTDRGIAALKVEKNTEFFDRKESSLYLRVSTTGVKAWRVRYRIPGSLRSRVMTLGRYPATGLAEARGHAAEASGKARRGMDPARERRRAAREEERAITFGELVERFLVTRQHRSKHTVKEYRRVLRHCFKGLHPLRLEDVERRDLADCLAQAGSPPVFNHNRNLMRMLWRYALREELVRHDPTATIDRIPHEVKEPRALTLAELASFWRATFELSPTMGGCFRLRTLTGARLRTVRRMRWEELVPAPDEDPSPLKVVSGAGREPWWLIPKVSMKKRRPFEVPITPEILAELQLLWRHTGECEWVLPGRVQPGKPRRPISSVVTAGKQIRKTVREELGPQALTGFTFHDLRTTMATWMLSQGATVQVVQALLAHKGQTLMERRYSAHAFDRERKEWLHRWTAYVVGTAGTVGAVISFSR